MNTETYCQQQREVLYKFIRKDAIEDWKVLYRKYKAYPLRSYVYFSLGGSKFSLREWAKKNLERIAGKNLE